MSNPNTIEVTKPGQYLTFHLKELLYGIPIGAVREINRVSEITPVPRTPAAVAGVMNLRGKVIPVVNLRTKLGLPTVEHTKATCIIVIDTPVGQVGMIVDSVSGVLELGAKQIEPTPDFGAGADTEFVLGLGKLEDRVVVLVDIVRALSVAQLSELGALTERLAA